MTAEKIHSISIPIAAILAGGSLALFVDSRFLVYVIGVFSVCAAAIYALLAYRKTLTKQPTVHHAVITFIAWAAAAALFGLRSLQIQPLWVVIIGGLLLSVFVGFSWMRSISVASVSSRIISLVAFEWFCVLLFAPGAYMVLGALFSVCTVAFASMFEKQQANVLTRTSIIQTTIATAAIASLFIAGFKWVL